MSFKIHSNNLWQRSTAILLQRCPRCLHGHVYHGLVAMHDVCPQCGYQFGREPGYFTGAMFASYTLAVPILFVIFVVLWHFFADTWTLIFNLLITFIVFPPLAPLIFRYSRMIWMVYLRSTKDHQHLIPYRQQDVL